MTRLEQLAQAIARYEGFYLTPEECKARSMVYPSIPQRYNNPGDLMFAGQPGARPSGTRGADGKLRAYAIFETVEQGWSALYAQIRKDAARGLNLRQFIAKYAPDTDGNDPSSYAAFVARELGVSLSDRLEAVITEPA
jgi:hypothetical protein